MIAPTEAHETAKPQEEGSLWVGVGLEHDCRFQILKESHFICFKSLKLNPGQSLWNIGLCNDSELFLYKRLNRLSWKMGLLLKKERLGLSQVKVLWELSTFHVFIPQLYLLFTVFICLPSHLQGSCLFVL